jgi:hypothetical protein
LISSEKKLRRKRYFQIVGQMCSIEGFVQLGKEVGSSRRYSYRILLKTLLRIKANVYRALELLEMMRNKR